MGPNHFRIIMIAIGSWAGVSLFLLQIAGLLV
jgi:hypothetical protein